MNKKHQIIKRKFSGTVVSDKMKKTVVVEVTRFKMNSKYLKHYKMTTRFKAHDEKGEYKTGDKVIIEATKPLSKEKKWIVKSLVEKFKSN